MPDNGCLQTREVELPVGLLDKEFTVGVIQLSSPFPHELTALDNWKFGWVSPNTSANEIQAVSRNDRIRRLLLDLSDTAIIQHHIDVLVFPEYAMSETAFPLLREHCLRDKTIIVAGSYNDTKRESVAYVFIPDGNEAKIVEQSKVTPSIFDADYLSHSVETGFIRLVWKAQHSDGTTVKQFIQVLVCFDFLSCSLDTIDPTLAGIVIVPMCSPKVEPFYGLAEYLVRWVRGHRSIAVALCNVTDKPKHPSGNACGNSQFVGPSHMQLHSLGRFKEGGIVATLNLDTAMVKPTRVKDDVYVITSQTKFAIRGDGSIEDTKGSEQEYFVVNPNAIIRDLGFQKIYALYEVRNYYEFRSHIRNRYMPIKSNGIFGVHDILFQGYEQNWKFFDSRLSYYLEQQYKDLRGESRIPEHYSITDVIKYRKIPLMRIDGDEYQPLFHYGEFLDYLVANLRELRKIIMGEDISEDIKRELLRMKVIMTVDSTSDISPEEKESGYEEYLIFVFMVPSRNSESKMAMQLFQNEVLQPMISDARVRTIELCREGNLDGASGSTGTYILHVVGRLDDLKDIIIESIHEKLHVHKIPCGTRVVPAAESLSEELYEPLKETVILDHFQQGVVYSIIQGLFSYPQPFIIKKLPATHIDEMVKFYKAYNVYIGNKGDSNELQGIQLRKELELNLYRFIYGTSISLLNQSTLTKEVFEENLNVFCSPLYNSVGQEVEMILRAAKEKIAAIVNIQEDLSAATWQEFRELLSKETSVLGDLLKIIGKWNTKVSPKNKVHGDEFTRSANNLSGFIRFRNYYSHAYDKEQIEKTATSDFASKSLTHALTAVGFVNQYAG